MVTPQELDTRKARLNRLSVEGILMRLREMPPTERVLTFRLLEKAKALEVFEQMDRAEQNELVRAMEDPQLIEFWGSWIESGRLNS
ncbi:MAG: hypothetical protein N3E49_04845 [Bacteroidia bacterium]|nr:hypothetical protein [Bacteroidia bacterium]